MRVRKLPELERGAGRKASDVTSLLSPLQPLLNGHANGNGNGNGHAPEPQQNIRAEWAQFLLTQTEDLINVYATASKYASDRHGNSVKAEDVRSLLLSAFINISKNGAGNVV